MLKRIYSKYEEIGKDVRDIIFKDEKCDLKQLLYLFAIPGAKIKWINEKKRYKVIARNDNFIIIAKPFNVKQTYMYSILDLEYMQCNRDNMIFGPKFNYSDKEECEEALKELQKSRDNNECDGLQLSQRGICNIKDMIEEIWIEVEVKKQV